MFRNRPRPIVLRYRGVSVWILFCGLIGFGIAALNGLSLIHGFVDGAVLGSVPIALGCLGLNPVFDIK